MALGGVAGRDIFCGKITFSGSILIISPVAIERIRSFL
jgi:hypothetical protein